MQSSIHNVVDSAEIRRAADSHPRASVLTLEGRGRRKKKIWKASFFSAVRHSGGSGALESWPEDSVAGRAGGLSAAVGNAMDRSVRQVDNDRMGVALNAAKLNAVTP